MPRWPRRSCVATGTGALGGRGAWGGGRPRTQAPADRARRTHRDDRASDGRRRGRRNNRSTILLVAVPTQVSSFRLLTLPCRYVILVGSDSNNNKLCDEIGVKRGETVGLIHSRMSAPVPELDTWMLMGAGLAGDTRLWVETEQANNAFHYSSTGERQQK